jgi:N-acetyl-anhydromuramyl-L-alanine amidase AmpD
MDGSLAGTDEWFKAATSRVSAHYGVGLSGEIHQYVKEKDTAYHCGKVQDPTWKSLVAGTNPNLYTIGVEHEGKGGAAWPEQMLLASVQLVADICKRNQIPVDDQHIVGHHEIYTGHACPGAGWDKTAYIEAVKNAGSVKDPAGVPSTT